MAMVQAQVLYRNAMRHGTMTMSATAVVGFEPQNAIDWRDFSIFRPPAGAPVNLDVAVTANETIDTACVWVEPFSATSIASLVLRYESSPGVFTTLATITNVQTGIVWIDFSSVTVLVGRKIRWQFNSVANPVTDPYSVRQLTVGQRITFPIGQWANINPPTLYQGVVVTNITAENGSILGRNIKRLEKAGEIDLTLLEPSWIRSVWDPLQQHAARFPFWYRWSPVAYPTEVAFAVAEGIDAPKNMVPAPRMSAKMSLRILTA